MNCPNCEREIPESSVFCPFCGSQVAAQAQEELYGDPYYDETDYNVQSKPRATGFWGTLESTLRVSPDAKKLGFVFYLAAIAFVFELVVFIFISKGYFSNWIQIIASLMLLAICLYKPEKFLTLSLIPLVIFAVEALISIIAIFKRSFGITTVWYLVVDILEMALLYPCYLIVSNKDKDAKKVVLCLTLFAVLPIVTSIIHILRAIFGSIYFLNFFMAISEIAFICVYVYAGFTVEKKRNPDAEWAQASTVRELAAALVPGLHEKVADKVSSAVHNTPQWDENADFIADSDEDEYSVNESDDQ